MLQDKQTERGPPPLTFVPQAFLRIRKSQHSISSTRSNPISPHRHYLSSSQPSLDLILTRTTKPHHISSSSVTLSFTRRQYSILPFLPSHRRLLLHSTSKQPSPFAPPPSLSPSLDDSTRFRHFFLLTVASFSLDRNSTSPCFIFIFIYSTSPELLVVPASRTLSPSLHHSTTSRFASTSSPEFLAINRASVASVHLFTRPILKPPLQSTEQASPPFTRPHRYRFSLTFTRPLYSKPQSYCTRPLYSTAYLTGLVFAFYSG